MLGHETYEYGRHKTHQIPYMCQGETLQRTLLMNMFCLSKVQLQGFSTGADPPAPLEVRRSAHFALCANHRPRCPPPLALFLLVRAAPIFLSVICLVYSFDEVQAKANTGRTNYVLVVITRVALL